MIKLTKIIFFFKALFFLFLYFIISILVYAIFSTQISQNNLVLANSANILADLIILFTFIIIFRKTLIPDYHGFKKNFKLYIKDYANYWLIGLALMIISNLIISNIIGDMPTTEELNRTILLQLPISSIISMVIVAPIIEELVTRHAFRDSFTNMYIYSLVSGLIFGSLHLLTISSLIEVLYIIPYSVLGVAFAMMYYKSNNIWTSIIFHSFHNLMCIIIIFVGVL